MSADFDKSPAEPGLRISPLEFLRKETAKLHAQLEASLDLKTSLGSVSTYRSLLYRYLSVYRPFEEALLSGIALLLDATSWRYHSKVALLERDLLALGPNLRAKQPMRRRTWISLLLFHRESQNQGASGRVSTHLIASSLQRSVVEFFVLWQLGQSPSSDTLRQRLRNQLRAQLDLRESVAGSSRCPVGISTAAHFCFVEYKMTDARLDHY